jgi:peptidoglycan/LPS O-acetylase OafA/YrhL
MIVSTKKRQDIQELRGISVLAVILFHAAKNDFSMGYLGVDIFFVISGFVVTPLIFNIFQSRQDSKDRIYFFNLLSFYLKRFYRLAPALFSVLIFFSIAFLLLINVEEHKSFARQGLTTIFLVGNVNAYKYNGEYFSSNPNALLHTWSLSVEEQIYIFLPLLLLLMFIIYKKIKIVNYYFVFGAISFFSYLFAERLDFFYFRIGVEIISQFSFYSPIDRLWQFSLGGLAFIISGKIQIRNQNQILKVLIIFLLIIILLSPLEFNSKQSTIVISLLAFLAIIFKSLESLPIFVRHKLKLVGDRSYSIYLVHMPIIYIVNNSLLFENFLSNSPTFFILLTNIVMSLILGAFNYSFVENKFRNRQKNTFKQFPTILITVSILPISILLIIFFGPDKYYFGLEKNEKRPMSSFNKSYNCKIFGTDIYDPCMVNNSISDNLVMLVGDSQAMSISAALLDSSLTSNFDLVVWTAPSCQFNTENKRKISSPCSRQNSRILKYIKTINPKVVIVAYHVDSSSNLIELRDSLLRIAPYTKSIILMENIPQFPDSKSYLVRKPILFDTHKSPISFRVEDMYKLDEDASNSFAKLVQREKIITFNTKELFCKSGACTRYINNEWLYFDVSHLSLAGARVIQPLINEYLSKSLLS